MTTMWDDFNTAVQAIDVAALDRAGLGDLAGKIGLARSVLDGLEARVAAGMRRLGASEASAAEMLRQRTGCSAREAKHRTRRAETLEKMPNVAQALSSGRLTGEHASALARAAAETSPEAVDRDAGLLVEASSMPADAASTKARDWVRRRQTDDDLQRLHEWQRRNRSLLFAAGEGGMIAGIAKFDRVSGAQFQNLVEALADRLYRADGGRDNPHARTQAQCRHDALLTLVGIEPAPPPHPELRSTSPNTNPGSPNTNPNGHHTSPDAASNGNARPKLSIHRQPLLPVPNVSPATDPPADPLFNPEPSPTRTLGSLPGISCGSSSGVGSGESLEAISRAGPGSSSGVGSGESLEAISRAGPGSSSGVGSGESLEVISRAGPGSSSGVGSGESLEAISRAGPGSSSGGGFGEVPEVISRAGPGVGLDTMSGLSPGVSRGCTCGRGFGPKAQLCIVMDVTYLATNGERGRCEIPGVGAIARSELERLGCDPEIYGILFDERGLSLHHGRKTRRVSPQQWRVLLARDRGCVICGAHPNWCQAHHVKYWSLGGLTDIDNLVMLCHAHHRWVHDNEITLRRGPNGWHAPAGLPSPRRSSRQPFLSLQPA